MESRRIMAFSRDKSILVTGSTGFLAKVFVEKLLRVQPGVKRLYLLIRAADATSAEQRMQNEIVGRELFHVLKKRHGGGGFESFVADKLFPVAGDVAEHNLGIRDSHLLQILFKEVEIVVNVAATTDIYERYDVSLSINAIGAKNALQFAQNCERMQLLLHVSTAFVMAGEPQGVVLEKKLEMGETLKGKNPDSNRYLDIEEEVRLVDKKMREVQAMSQEEQKAALVDLAGYFGWRNTYVFTKAMGEMLLGHSRGNTPLVILRPAIISSVYRDPLPGWIEGVRTTDSLILGYAKGMISCFLGDPEMIIDLIPADMVVNVMIVTMAAHSNGRSEFIYHVGSSMRHPMTYAALFQYINDYFLKISTARVGNNNEREERIIKARRKLHLFTSFLGFRIYMMIRYKLPLKVMHLIANLRPSRSSGLFSTSQYKQLKRTFFFTELLFDLYRPYLFSMESFDDLNLERLRTWMREDEEEDAGDEMECNCSKRLDLDPRNVGDWKSYFCNIHIPGLLRSAL